MLLRNLTDRDLPAVKSLIRGAFAAEPWNDRWDDEDIFDQYIADLTQNANSVALGLFQADALVALALGRLKHWFNGTEFAIDDLCVSPACQGSGIGSELIRHLQAYARKNNIAKLSLKTSRDAPAYYFYRKNGFEEQTRDVFFELPCRES